MFFPPSYLGRCCCRIIIIIFLMLIIDPDPSCLQGSNMKENFNPWFKTLIKTFGHFAKGGKSKFLPVSSILKVGWRDMCFSEFLPLIWCLFISSFTSDSHLNWIQKIYDFQPWKTDWFTNNDRSNGLLYYLIFSINFRSTSSICTQEHSASIPDLFPLVMEDKLAAFLHLCYKSDLIGIKC